MAGSVTFDRCGSPHDLLHRLVREEENPSVAVKLVLAMGAVVAQRQRELTCILTDLLELEEPGTDPDPDTLAAKSRSSLA